jgi:hypothetical protein
VNDRNEWGISRDESFEESNKVPVATNRRK